MTKKLLTFLTLLTLFFGVGWAAEGDIHDMNQSFSKLLNNSAQISPVDIQEQTYPIKAVTINWTYNKSEYASAVTIEVKVDGTSWGTKTVGGKQTAVDAVFEGASTTGAVQIIFTNNTGSGTGHGTFTVNSIKLTEGASGTPATTHNITYATVTGGSFSGPESAAEGATVTLTATPDDAYTFTSWNVTDEDGAITVTDNQFTMGTSDVTVSGVFTEKTKYAITVTGGTADLATAYEGQTVTLTPEIPTGKVIDWDNTSVSPNTVSINHDNYKFTMPGEAVTVVFAFKNAPTYVFYEPFTGTDGYTVSGNSNFDNNAGGGNNIVYVSGFGEFSLTSGKGAGDAIKLGASGTKGSATTPTITGLTSGKTYILTFKAAPWATENAGMNVAATGGTLSGLSTAMMEKQQWNDFSATFVATGTEAQFTFTATRNRFFLDEVMLDVAPETEYNIYRTIKTNGEISDAGGWLGNWTNCTVDEEALNAGNANYTVTAPAGETVQFKAGTKNNYKILESHVSAVDANNTPVALTKESSDDSGIIFSFTMPASAVTISANFTDYYHPTLHLAGRFNGRPESTWITDSSGPAFTFDEDKDEYTINAYFTGAVTDYNNGGAKIDYFYLRADNNDLKANASGDCWVDENGGTYNLGGNSNFRIYPGVYTITVKGSRSQAVITKVTPELSLSHPAGEVLSGTTISATSNLAELIAAIKANDNGAQGDVSVKVCTDGTSYNLDEVTLTSNQTVYGKAWIGNLAVPVEAAYTIKQFETVAPDYTEAFSENFGKFFADNNTIWTIYNSDCARASAYFNGAATASESWLYSPYIDLTNANNPKLSFSHAGNFFKTDGQSQMAEDVKVMIREFSNNEWSGWTALDGVTYPDGGSYTFVDFEKLMTSYVGKTIQIAFKYTSTIERAGTWEIKDFKVAELYNITCNTADNGSITASPNPATAGETVTITVSPATGYELATLVYNDGTDHDIKAAKSFTMPAANVTVTATFEEQVISANDFQLVTDASQIKAGYEYIIASGDFLRVMGVIGSSDNKAPCTDDFDIDDNHMIITAGNSVNILTLSGTTDAWLFQQKDGKYIYLENGKTNIIASSRDNENGYSKTLNIKINDGDKKYAVITNETYTSQEPSRQIEYQTNATSGNGQFGHYASSNVTGNGTAYTRVYLYYRESAPAPTAISLADLCRTAPVNNEPIGEVGKSYTINEALSVVYAKGNSIWVKDADGSSVVKDTPADGDMNYEIVWQGNPHEQQADYDQSNWLEIQLASGSEAVNNLYGTTISANKITGTFTNKTNPTMTGVTIVEGDLTQGGGYTPNYYCTANFDGSQNATAGAHSDEHFFFVKPKPQEYAQIVWAKYNAANSTMVMPSASEGNGHGFSGSFAVDLEMNTGATPEDGKVYNFEAIVRKVGSAKSTEYKVYPLNIQDPVPTAVTDVTGKTVAGVKYYNLAGMASDKPFDGVNIIVTTYTDGSRSSAKVLR